MHEGIELGWRLMDAGWRVRYAGDVVALHPAPTGRPHRYSYYFGARNSVWLARRYLPLPLGALYVLVFALRTVPRLSSRRALREAMRGYRDGVRVPAGPRRRLKARDAGPDVPSGAPAHHVTREMTTTAPHPPHHRENDFATQHHVYEPHLVGLPPMGPYIREAWRRRNFATELARTKLRAQHYNTFFGQLWLILNPLLLAGVYYILVDILRAGSAPARVLRAPDGGPVRLLLRVRRRARRGPRRSCRAGG